MVLQIVKLKLEYSVIKYLYFQTPFKHQVFMLFIQPSIYFYINKQKGKTTVIVLLF